MNVMIVVPHPDDEILGFGGVIQKHIKSGDKVMVCFFTQPYHHRLEDRLLEVPKISKEIGYQSKICQMDLTDENHHILVGILEKEIELFKPDILYSTFYGDNHNDHQYVFDIVRVAARVWSDFLVKKICLGEIPSSTDQSPKLPQFTFLPTLYVPLDKWEVKKKVEYMKLYKNEVCKWPHPRSEKGVFNLAERRGSECKQEYAEAFMILRDIALQ